MSDLEDIILNLKDKAKDSGHYVSKIINIKGLQRLTLQINASPDGHVSMTVHSKSNFKKQIGVTASDAGDLMLISKFLTKYSGTLDKYVKFSKLTVRNNDDENVVDIDDDNNDQKPQQKEKGKHKERPKNIEDEF
ncbi:hypothetical protein ARV1_gp12 [Acidianus rod-shaped virus 1]|uniref:PHA01746-like domain-containing protein n=1 Tax=Acidianus rod-shaped virus 1 TaxID=309181 RepID=Q50I59_9VIRU|nr:hypothetical protein ARV1_gp12 [Acidianus rod-shaped virus 1]CAI44167.1 hypothetical protein [Acidianus rod-shaped virus 1]